MRPPLPAFGRPPPPACAGSRRIPGVCAHGRNPVVGSAGPLWRAGGELSLSMSRSSDGPTADQPSRWAASPDEYDVW